MNYTEKTKQRSTSRKCGPASHSFPKSLESGHQFGTHFFSCKCGYPAEYPLYFFIAILAAILLFPLTALSQPTKNSAEFENRFASFFNQRLNTNNPVKQHSLSKSTSAQVTSEQSPISLYDRMRIPEMWNSLSEGFKKQYQQSLIIPESFTAFVSPSNNFEIYYTTSGDDAVDPTDTISFSATNWRFFQSVPNNVPDYIDFLAYGLDSAWSAHVERFGFLPAVGFRSASYPSQRYKVTVRQLPSQLYGQTYHIQRLTDNSWASIVEMRNEWNDEIWSRFESNYQQNPELGLFVTAAHEFFHSIQFRYLRYFQNPEIGIPLDNFLLSWIEGTAVLFEEILFEEIDDFHQYSEDFFINPEQAVYNPTYAYFAGLFHIFMWEKTASVEQIKRCLELNAETDGALSFSDLIALSSQQTAFPLNRLLGNYFSESYFTGVRAKPGVFINDAPELQLWLVPPTETLFPQFVSLEPFSPSFFSFFVNPAQHPDTVTVTWKVATNDTQNTAIHLIGLRDEIQTDTILTPQGDANGLYSLQIDNWKQYDTLVSIVTNSHNEKQLGYKLSIIDPAADTTLLFKSLSSPVSAPLPEEIVLSPNPVSLMRNGQFSIIGSYITQVVIYTLSGKKVFESHLAPTQNNEFVFPYTKQLSPGTYTVMVTVQKPQGITSKHFRNRLLVVP